MISRLQNLINGNARRLKFFRYTAGSVVAFATSEIVFIALFAPQFLGAKGASIVASLAGIAPGYYLNRNWAWQRSGRSHPVREVLPYWIIAIVSTTAAALSIGAVNGAASDMSRDVRTIINAATYMVVYGIIFVAKYLVFNHMLFRDRASDPKEPQEAEAGTY